MSGPSEPPRRRGAPRRLGVPRGRAGRTGCPEHCARKHPEHCARKQGRLGRPRRLFELCDGVIQRQGRARAPLPRVANTPLLSGPLWMRCIAAPCTRWARRTPGLILASPSSPWQATIGDYAARVQRPSRRAGAPGRGYIARPLRGGTGAGGPASGGNGVEGSSEGEQDLFAGTDRAWEVPGGPADLARRFAEAEEQSKRDSQARAPPRPHRLSPSPPPLRRLGLARAAALCAPRAPRGAGRGRRERGRESRAGCPGAELRTAEAVGPRPRRLRRRRAPAPAARAVRLRARCACRAGPGGQHWRLMRGRAHTSLGTEMHEEDVRPLNLSREERAAEAARWEVRSLRARKAAPAGLRQHLSCRAAIPALLEGQPAREGGSVQ